MNMTISATGTALLQLPPKTSITTTLVFSAAERTGYHDLEKAAKKEYLQLRRDPSLVMKNTIKLLAAMTPLRQACSGGPQPSAADISSAMSGAAALAASKSTCGLCHEAIEEPQRTHCGHQFCKEVVFFPSICHPLLLCRV
jgi:hypothetical protein